MLVTMCCVFFPIYGSIGIICLVIGGNDRKDHPTPTCGLHAKPPLRDWIFGNGVICMTVVGVGSVFLPLLFKGVEGSTTGKCLACLTCCIMYLAHLMCFVWAIVGAVSLANSHDCKDVDNQLWSLGLASVIIMFILSCCGGSQSKRN